MPHPASHHSSPLPSAATPLCGPVPLAPPPTTPLSSPCPCPIQDQPFFVMFVCIAWSSPLSTLLRTLLLMRGVSALLGPHPAPPHLSEGRFSCTAQPRPRSGLSFLPASLPALPPQPEDETGGASDSRGGESLWKWASTAHGFFLPLGSCAAEATPGLWAPAPIASSTRGRYTASPRLGPDFARTRPEVAPGVTPSLTPNPSVQLPPVPLSPRPP